MSTENKPACFGILNDPRNPDCNTRCSLFNRCAAAYLLNVREAVESSVIVRIPVSSKETTCAGVAREVVLEKVQDPRPFRASEFHAAYFERCRMNGIDPGDVKRNVRKALANLKNEGLIRRLKHMWMKA